MKSVFLGSFVAVSVATAATTIPSGISSGCSSYLTSLNTNTQFASCVTDVLTATNGLTPTSSSSSLTTALTSLCSSTTTEACSDSFLRTQLTMFYSQCSADFTESTGFVHGMYDMLYALAPFLESVCTTDTSASGKFCVQTLAASTGSSSSSLISSAQTFLSANNSTTPPNFSSTIWSSTNILFQFLTATSSQSTLCSACASKIMQTYITFETAEAYGPGNIANSNLLGGQTALWSAMSKTCGGSSSIVVNAGAAPTAGAIGAGALGSGAGSTKVSAAVVGGLALFSAALAGF